MSVPFVWIVFTMRLPGRRYFSRNSTERRKKSRPISVGSPPCHATVTSGPGCASMSCRMYVSRSESVMRKRLPGYRLSFDRKKQYWQSRLQIAPVGFTSR